MTTARAIHAAQRAGHSWLQAGDLKPIPLGDLSDLCVENSAGSAAAQNADWPLPSVFVDFVPAAKRPSWFTGVSRNTDDGTLQWSSYMSRNRTILALALILCSGDSHFRRVSCRRKA